MYKSTMIDIFCGAGVGAVGFQQAGFDILLGVDNEQYAVDTYNNNIGDHAICSDIRDLDLDIIPDADVIVGTPPCLPFSVSGKNEGLDDEKYGDLFSYFINIVEYKKPKSIFIENVKGLISKKHNEAFKGFLSHLNTIGYDVTWKLINMLDYGLAQKRERVFIIGFRKDLNINFKFPEPTFNPKTIREVIGDLPEPEDEHNFKNHIGFGIRKDELPFIDKIKHGQNWKFLPIEDQKTFMGKAYYSTGGCTGFLRKMSFDSNALTITSTMQGKFNSQILDMRDKYNDPSQTKCRRFTVRECLRLQSVPDWFYFDENISLSRMYTRCSGVPTELAKLLGIEIIKYLNGEIKSEKLKELF